jgi:hypothetical protein
VPGHVTVIGDSVTLDAAGWIEDDIPGVDVEAGIGRQWSQGEQLADQLHVEGRLGSVVVIALGTNGPVSTADFAQMAGLLAGASRVVFVTNHVDQPWQDPNNAVLAAGVAVTANAELADWNELATPHPEWFSPDGTHMPFAGEGAEVLAGLVAASV